MSKGTRLVIAIALSWIVIFSLLYFVIDTASTPRWGGFFMVGVAPSFFILLGWWVYIGFKK